MVPFLCIIFGNILGLIFGDILSDISMQNIMWYIWTIYCQIPDMAKGPGKKYKVRYKNFVFLYVMYDIQTEIFSP